MELKRKLKKKQKTETSIDLGEAFNVANAKDKDFDLDMDAATFIGKKGQAGTRTKSGGGGDSLAQTLSEMF